MKVYVVFGATGEYSDHRDWTIHAYTDEHVAQEHVLKASERSRELLAQYHSRYDIPDGANEWDRQMRIDYTGVNYEYVAVEVFDTLTRDKVNP